MPVGPHILCPENARKSQPNSPTSIGKWPTPCAASTSVSAPTACAFAQSSATGLIVPREFEIWVNANSFPSGVTSEESCSSSTVPSSRARTKPTRAPGREELEYLRGERSNPHWCWQFCAHHNLLRAPPRATLFEEGKSEETSSSAS